MERKLLGTVIMAAGVGFVYNYIAPKIVPNLTKTLQVKDDGSNLDQAKSSLIIGAVVLVALWITSFALDKLHVPNAEL